MNKNYLFAFIAIVALLFFIIAFLSGKTTRYEPNSQSFPTSNAITQTPQNISPSPTPLSGTNRSENIIVDFPKSGETVGRPLIVTGQARTFEQSVSLRLSQTDGKVLVEAFTTSIAPDLGMFGLFEKELLYAKPTQSTGVLEVFQSSPKDGSEVDKVTVPVRFEE